MELYQNEAGNHFIITNYYDLHMYLQWCLRQSQLQFMALVRTTSTSVASIVGRPTLSGRSTSAFRDCVPACSHHCHTCMLATQSTRRTRSTRTIIRSTKHKTAICNSYMLLANENCLLFQVV